VGVEPGPGGEGEGGEQDLVLGLEPGQCLPVVGVPLGSGARPGRGQGDRLMRRVQHEGARTGGVQVMVKGPASGGFALGITVGVAGLGGGVGTQQVVEGIPARGVLADQVGPGELAEHAARLWHGRGGEAGGGGDAVVGAGMQTEQPEHPRRGVTELPVGPGEHRADTGLRIPGVQCVQPAGGVVEFRGQVGQGEGGPGGGTRRGDRQR
jgi:hypothetical protein